MVDCLVPRSSRESAAAATAPRESVEYSAGWEPTSNEIPHRTGPHPSPSAQPHFVDALVGTKLAASGRLALYVLNCVKCVKLHAGLSAVLLTFSGPLKSCRSEEKGVGPFVCS